MKKTLFRNAVVFIVVFAFVCTGGITFALDNSGNSQSNNNDTYWGKFDQGKQGGAKEGMENTAEKKTKDVNVPDVPPPKPADPSQVRSENNTSIILAQNANYIPCYKDVDMKMVLFRWCPTGSPWTTTNEKRTYCYATSEACAAAEMPQSWCIKCGNKDGS